MGVDTYVIEVERFLQVRALVSVIPDHLRRIAEEMKRTYRCFSDEGHEKRFYPRQQVVRHVEARSRIGSRVLSKEAISKKEFMVHANKMTHKNKDSIIQAFKPHIRKECIDIYMAVVWDLIQRAPEYQDIYADFIASICADTGDVLHEKFTKIFDNYVASRNWYPSAQMVTEDYDEFCEFVKWKKRAVAAVQAFKLFVARKWLSEEKLVALTDDLVSELNGLLAQSTGCSIADALLEQLAYLPIKNETVIKTLSDKSTSLRPSTKFKILDLVNGFQRYHHPRSRNS